MYKSHFIVKIFRTSKLYLCPNEVIKCLQLLKGIFVFGEIRQKFCKKSGAKESSEANIRIRARIVSLYQSLAKTLSRCVKLFQVQIIINRGSFLMHIPGRLWNMCGIGRVFNCVILSHMSEDVYVLGPGPVNTSSCPACPFFSTLKTAQQIFTTACRGQCQLY